MRGNQNWQHRNPAETIYETGQLIEQLDNRPLQLKNQIKAIELRENFRKRTQSETGKKISDKNDEVVLALEPIPMTKKKRYDRVSKAVFEGIGMIFVTSSRFLSGHRKTKVIASSTISLTFLTAVL